MRIAIFLLICLVLFSDAFAQQDVDVKSVQRSDHAVDVVAVHNGFCPVTIKITGTLKNMKSTVDLPAYFLVYPAKDSAQVLCSFSVDQPRKKTQFSYRYTQFLGDVLNTQHDDDFVYELPFAMEETYRVIQGYNGSYSHQGQNSLDFNMKNDSPVYATRGGIVVGLQERSTKGCPSPSCRNDANFVGIYHSDGTIGQYVHLKYQGAEVALGDRVEQGDLIGYSGNTGWSSGPHLHFDVYIVREGDREYVPTKFRLPNGKVDYLKEDHSYKRTKLASGQ